MKRFILVCLVVAGTAFLTFFLFKSHPSWFSWFEPVTAAALPSITQQEWDVARKALVINGYTEAVVPDTGATCAQVMINRMLLNAGESFSSTNQNVQFVWRIDALAGRDLRLAQVSAQRVPFAQTITPRKH